jgi:succinate-semialdehyde dehydrogenase / glutarate-semialdehyde dehydrogenase
MTFQTINPSTDEVLQTYRYISNAELNIKLENSYLAYSQWKQSSLSRRKQFLQRLASELRDALNELSKLMTNEMGKPLAQSKVEVEKCAKTCDYLSEHFEAWLEPDRSAPPGVVYKEPLGPVFAIMPWNFPLWQLIRCGAPTLAGGNTVILKHSDIVAGTAEMIEKIFARASGEQQNLLVSLCIDHKQSESVIQDPRLGAVTFTGSTAGGMAVAAVAGANLKKIVLELGGSDAYLVCEDADFHLAADAAINSRLINSGQSCIAAKRFFVHENIAKEFLRQCFRVLETQKVGSPLDLPTTVGPLAHKRFKIHLAEQVEKFKTAGAVSLWRSDFNLKSPAFAEIELLKCDPQVEIFHQEEIFGPVGLFFEVADMAEAVFAANRSPYGLGAAVFSKDINQATAIAQKLECGYVAINDFVKTDARLAFGGIKHSGFGRELGLPGFLEFLNLKTVVPPVVKS